MKTQFVNFAGGLMVGLLLSMVSSAYLVNDEVEVKASALSTSLFSDNPRTSFIEVPIQEFLDDVSRYNTTHAKVIATRMPVSPNRPDSIKYPSRMFTYSLTTLEDFFTLVRKYGTGLKADQLAIRFYYGVYPKGKKVAKEDYGSLHTLFMVPNHWNKRDKQYHDIDLKGFAASFKKLSKTDLKKMNENKLDSLIESHYLKNLVLHNPQAEAFILDASAVKYTGPFPVKTAGFFPGPLVEEYPTVINQGQLCPPNCPTTSLLDDRTIDW